MATTQYIGSRYVPVFADPIEWSNTTAYEPLTIVTHEGNSYTTKQYTPKGIDITNTDYWALTGNYNAQIEQYRMEVQAHDARITANTTSNTSQDAQLAGTSKSGLKTLIESVTDKIANINFTSDINDTFFDNAQHGILYVDSNYTVPTGKTITCDVMFVGGILSGTYSITGHIYANPTEQIFADSNVTIDSKTNPIGYPEWFGAVTENNEFDCSKYIDTCIQKFPITHLNAAKYYIADTIHMNGSYHTLEGEPRSTSGTYANGSMLIITDLTKVALRIGDDTDNSNPSTTHISVHDITVTATNQTYTNSVAGIEVHSTRALHIQDVLSLNFVIGYDLMCVISSYFTRCRFINDAASTVTTRMIGFNINQSMTVTIGLSTMCSVWFFQCDTTFINHSQTNSTYGFFSAAGTSGLADFMIEECNLFGNTTGIYIAAKEDYYTQQNIFITHNTIDNVCDCIAIEGPIKAVISDNWLATGAISSQEIKHAIVINNNSRGMITIANNNFKEGEALQAAANVNVGVRANNSNNILLNGNIYYNVKKPIWFTKCSNISINDSVVDYNDYSSYNCCELTTSTNSNVSLTLSNDAKYATAIKISSDCVKTRMNAICTYGNMANGVIVVGTTALTSDDIYKSLTNYNTVVGTLPNPE